MYHLLTPRRQWQPRLTRPPCCDGDPLSALLRMDLPIGQKVQVRSQQVAAVLFYAQERAIQRDGLCDHLSSGERHAVACMHCSPRFDNGVHARAGELACLTDFNPVVLTERPEDIGVLV